MQNPTPKKTVFIINEEGEGSRVILPREGILTPEGEIQLAGRVEQEVRGAIAHFKARHGKEIKM